MSILGKLWYVCVTFFIVFWGTLISAMVFRLTVSGFVFWISEQLLGYTQVDGLNLLTKNLELLGLFCLGIWFAHLVEWETESRTFDRYAWLLAGPVFLFFTSILFLPEPEGSLVLPEKIMLLASSFRMASLFFLAGASARSLWWPTLDLLFEKLPAYFKRRREAKAR